MIVLGFGSVLFGMTSCRKVCNCTLFQANEKINKYMVEREDRSQKCADLTNSYMDEEGKLNGMHCE